ncbi:MAG: hypothetical protein IJ185_07545 [Prevotella sp.]|jgi:di/tricarboxylate transporter|nr:hypothetical protein [Prevotella sp.]
MGSLNILQTAKKNLWSIIALVVVLALVGYSYVDEIQGMNNASTDYDYCYHLVNLYELICKSIFAIIYFIMCQLTYINKQYSKWSIWLFYLSAIVLLIHFFISGFIFEYVYAHVGVDHMDDLPKLARYIFGAPAYFVILSLFFVPKFIKDTIKLKKEQELTI